MNDATLTSKILVLDSSTAQAPGIKRFCEANNLVALKVRKEAVMAFLRTNVDLGGVLFSETYGDSPLETSDIAIEIHTARPELPIIIRREKEATLDGLPEGDRRLYCAAYVASDMGALRKVLDEYIFCMVYPNALLRGIAEITEAVLISQRKTLKISLNTPYIVHDRMISGELFSLIQLESSWCRGFMMLQAEEAGILAMAHSDRPNDDFTFRDLNDILSEITNMIWGAFKNRYIGEKGEVAGGQSQVPLIVNHKRRYISFGSGSPHLCFRYTLTDDVAGTSTTLYERFIFNLSWSPDDFKEIHHDASGIFASGEVEMF
jgi:hypothetical protein